MSPDKLLVVSCHRKAGGVCRPMVSPTSLVYVQKMQWPAGHAGDLSRHPALSVKSSNAERILDLEPEAEWQTTNKSATRVVALSGGDDTVAANSTFAVVVQL